MVKAKDMTREVINHTYCSFCDYRRMVAGDTYWGCNLDEKKLDELCPYKLAIKQEEQAEEKSAAK